MTASTPPRLQTRGEELANSFTHGIALLASVAAIPLLVVAARGPRDAWQLVGGLVFGVTLVMLYLASTLYHAAPDGRAKQLLRVVDHSAIYLLIAGTYTPFTLGVLRGAWGWTLLAVIWVIAAIGITAKWTFGFRFPRVSTALYLAMGWLIVIAIQPLVTHVSAAGLAWIVAGGVCYTGGVVFYVNDQRIRFGHAIWHLFVVAGSACHFFAVFGHAASPAG